MPAEEPTILATSGGSELGRRVRWEFNPLTEYAIELSGVTGRPPRICGIGTAVGDDPVVGLGLLRGLRRPWPDARRIWRCSRCRTSTTSRHSARPGRHLGQRRQRRRAARDVASCTAWTERCARPGRPASCSPESPPVPSAGTSAAPPTRSGRTYARYQRPRPPAVLQRRALRLRGAAPTAVPGADRRRHAAGRLRHRRRRRPALPRYRIRRGGRRTGRRRRVLRGAQPTRAAVETTRHPPLPEAPGAMPRAPGKHRCACAQPVTCSPRVSSSTPRPGTCSASCTRRGSPTSTTRHRPAARAPDRSTPRASAPRPGSGRSTARRSSTSTAAARSPGTAPASWSATRSCGWPTRSTSSPTCAGSRRCSSRSAPSSGSTPAGSRAAAASGSSADDAAGPQGRRDRHPGRARRHDARLRAQLRPRPGAFDRIVPAASPTPASPRSAAELGRDVTVADVHSPLVERPPPPSSMPAGRAGATSSDASTAGPPA